MKRCRVGIIGLLLACAGSYAAPAAAQVSTEISASNLRYVVTDLTPDDGQASWFSFLDSDLSPLSASSSVEPRAGIEQSAADSQERIGTFAFSAHTQISIAVDLHIAMQAVPLSEPEQSGRVEYGFIAIATWGPPKDRMDHRDSDSDFRTVGRDVSGAFIPEFYRDETIWLTITNDSDYATVGGEFRIVLDSTAHAMAAPVPEAPAPAMLALGVGMLGVVGRRRARARVRAGLAIP